MAHGYSQEILKAIQANSASDMPKSNYKPLGDARCISCRPGKESWRFYPVSGSPFYFVGTSGRGEARASHSYVAVTDVLTSQDPKAPSQVPHT